MVSLRLIFFIKQIEYIPSIFDIYYSIFDILFFKVSILIRLAVFLASGPGSCETSFNLTDLPLRHEDTKKGFFNALGDLAALWLNE
jgi:hypothetical protein